jgi:acyl-CoA thioesterase
MTTMTHLNQQSNTLNGMDRVRFFEKQTQTEGMAKNLGFKLQQFSEGKVQLLYRTKERHQNLIGSLHGGIIASLLDSAMGLAVTTHLHIGEGLTMTDLFYTQGNECLPLRLILRMNRAS